MRMRPELVRRLRSRGLPAASLGLLVIVAVFVRRGPVGTALVALLLLALVTTVGTHLRLERRRPRRASRSRGPDRLRTPAQVGLGLVIVVVVGSLVAVVLTLVLSAVASSAVGDGGVLLRLLLALVALGPCFSIGYRCGRWWSFLGAAALVPVLVMCVLVAGPRSAFGFEVVLPIVASVAFAASAGSLQRALPRRRERARRRAAMLSTPEVDAPSPARALAAVANATGLRQLP
jgi:hypothetical protein